MKKIPKLIQQILKFSPLDYRAKPIHDLDQSRAYAIDLYNTAKMEHKLWELLKIRLPQPIVEPYELFGAATVAEAEKIIQDLRIRARVDSSALPE
jgi:hypothetical protein